MKHTQIAPLATALLAGGSVQAALVGHQVRGRGTDCLMPGPLTAPPGFQPQPPTKANSHQ